MAREPPVAYRTQAQEPCTNAPSVWSLGPFPRQDRANTGLWTPQAGIVKLTKIQLTEANEVGVSQTVTRTTGNPWSLA